MKNSAKIPSMTTSKATRAGFGDGLLDIAAKYPKIVTIDADLRHSVQTMGFAKKYPKRAFQVGIAEQNMIGVAAGLATAGYIPFAATFAVFATGLCYNQIRQSVCYSEKNVKIVGTHAGILTGEDGATHQALEDIALMRGLPNMRVYCPADYNEARAMMPLIAVEDAPCYLRLGRQTVTGIYDEKYKPKLGKMDILHPSTGSGGAKYAIFATGTEVSFALAAAEIVKEKTGKRLTVINVSTLKPFDTKTTLAVAKGCARVFTAEDHSIIGGLGSCVAETLAEAGLGVPLTRLGMRDQFGESGTSDDLLKKYQLDAAGLAKQIIKAIK